MHDIMFSLDFSTLYTTIPHDKLKSKLKEIINQCFFHKNGDRRFQYVVIGYKDTYSRTSMARTPMARLPWLFRTRFWVPTKLFR